MGEEMKANRFKIGAWIDIRLKQKINLLRAYNGKQLQDIYEEALSQYIEKELPKYEGQ